MGIEFLYASILSTSERTSSIDIAVDDVTVSGLALKVNNNAVVAIAARTTYFFMKNLAFKDIFLCYQYLNC